MNPRTYTVHALAELAGVSVRTLHHYDQIGLLAPSARTEAGYRLYGPADLRRLQQILFYRELDVPLAEIKRLLDDRKFKATDALRDHRGKLQAERVRLGRLVRTIDRTLKNMEDDMPLTDEELYEGFASVEQGKQYEEEAMRRWDPALVAESQRRVRKMSKQEWVEVRAEGQAVTLAAAELMGHDPADAKVQAVMARWHRHIERFYPCSAEIFRGLGQGYVSDERFRAFYEKVKPGLAEFMRDAMAVYAERMSRR